MRRAAVLVLLLCSVALAGRALRLQQVVKPKERLTKRLLLLVDTSGSMSGASFAQALSCVRALAGQATDDMELAVVSFDTSPERWVYKGQTWVRLPNAKAVRAAGRWVRAQGPGGMTYVSEGLEQALRDPKDKLTVVVVSDGGFSEPDVTVQGTLAREQRARRKRKLRPALVASLGVGRGVAALSSSSMMAHLGRAGRGGFWRAVPAKRRRGPH